jgi:hypothetical protein
VANNQTDSALGGTGATTISSLERYLCDLVGELTDSLRQEPGNRRTRRPAGHVALLERMSAGLEEVGEALKVEPAERIDRFAPGDIYHEAGPQRWATI